MHQQKKPKYKIGDEVIFKDWLHDLDKIKIGIIVALPGVETQSGITNIFFKILTKDHNYCLCRNPISKPNKFFRKLYELDK